jgi:ABC-type nitrate/sulfonate/bicarbonate transport system substrate-binding protein
VHRLRLTKRTFLLGGLLAGAALALVGLTRPFSGAGTGTGPIETPHLTLGYLKQTDAAPIIVAKELGYFAAEGLDVTLEPQSDISVLEARLLSGALDGSQAPVGLPLATRIWHEPQRRPTSPASGLRCGVRAFIAQLPAALLAGGGRD